MFKQIKSNPLNLNQILINNNINNNLTVNCPLKNNWNQTVC